MHLYLNFLIKHKNIYNFFFQYRFLTKHNDDRIFPHNYHTQHNDLFSGAEINNNYNSNLLYAYDLIFYISYLFLLFHNIDPYFVLGEYLDPCSLLLIRNKYELYIILKLWLCKLYFGIILKDQILEKIQ